MHPDAKVPRNLPPLRRALLEIGFIIFLFYANLLMGEFTVSSGHNKTLLAALHDLFTPMSMIIALVSALIGFAAYEYIRRKL